MALSKTTGTHIHHLPEETIDYIMGFLPLSDRKSASLVCRRWAVLAFSYRYLATVRLRLKEQELIEKRLVVDVLEKSWRTYRNLTVDFGSSAIDIVWILVILKKFGEHIEVFGSQSLFTPVQLKEMLQRLPSLRRLVVNVTNDAEVHLRPQDFPVLAHLVDFRSTDAIFDVPGINVLRVMPSVRNLSMYFRRNVTENSFQALGSLSPQLTTLEVFADFNRAPIELLDLRHLETLKLWGTNFYLDNESLRQLFTGIPKLTVLFLHIRMSVSLLEVICDNCPQLTTFGFIADRMEHRSLCVLEKLKNLKILLIDGCLKHHMIDGCKPLPTVETFCLYWHKKLLDPEAFVKQLNNMLPNVRALKVIGTRSKQMDHALMIHIGRIFTKLNRLTVADFEFPEERQLEGDGFDWLGDLANVEQLTLSSMRLMRIGTQRQSSVKRLRLEHFDWLLGDGLLQMAKIFPCLKYLKINRCALITGKDVEMAQRAMPNCVINFVDRKPRWLYRAAVSVA